MPLYRYECPECGIVDDVWAKIDDQELPHECGCSMHRIISAPNIAPDWQPYFDENLCSEGDGSGAWVKSRQHRRQLMGRLGLTNQWGEGRKQRWV